MHQILTVEHHQSRLIVETRVGHVIVVPLTHDRRIGIVTTEDRIHKRSMRTGCLCRLCGYLTVGKPTKDADQQKGKDCLRFLHNFQLSIT